MENAVMLLVRLYEEKRMREIYACATPFQQAMFMMCMAWMHLRSLTIAMPRLQEIMKKYAGGDLDGLLANDDEAAYYHGRVLASRFYLGTEFPKFAGMIDAVLSDESAVIDAVPRSFTGAPF
jgi:hypothetical protein